MKLLMIGTICLLLSGCGDNPTEKVYLDDVTLKEVLPDGTLGHDVLKSTPIVSWYNYRTGEHDHLQLGWVGDFSAYIPQIPSAQGLYQTYIAMGETPLEACGKTLSAFIEALEKGRNVTSNKKIAL